jgi:hypothetical protein
MVDAQVLAHVSHVQYALGAVLTLARREHVVLVLVEVGGEMVVEGRAFHVAELFVVRQGEALQAVGAKVTQRVCVFLKKTKIESFLLF